VVQLRQTPSAFVLLFFAAGLFACGGGTDAPSGKTGQSSGSRSRTASSNEGNGGLDPQAPAETAGDQRLGAPLADPSRYYGVFASADRPDRQWFVTMAKRPKYAEQAPEVPPGHLALGAMFGDVAPFHLKTLSDTGFEQAWVSDYQPEPISIEFELGDDGRAVAFTFTDTTNASLGRLERQGDLPEGWE